MYKLYNTREKQEVVGEYTTQVIVCCSHTREEEYENINKHEITVNKSVMEESVKNDMIPAFATMTPRIISA